MTETIPIIDSEDGFEMVRNAVANILAIEVAKQVILATAASKPTPEDWNLDVYLERNNPWEKFRDQADEVTPVVNVWYENSGLEKQRSNNLARHSATSTIKIDCVAGEVTEITDTGQVSGDSAAMLKAHRVARLVRRILSHPKYISLGLETIVHERWMTNRQAFTPSSGDAPIEHTGGVQLTYSVSHNEFVDLETIGPAEGALITIKHDPDGAVIAQMEIDWTPTP